MGANPSQSDWLSRVIVRLAKKEDLSSLEWEGEFTHFRRVYADAYRRSEQGLGLIWVAILPEVGLIGQVFIQFICDRHDLADGKQRAYLYSFRVRPEYRGHGVGKRVLQVVEDDLRLRGFHYLTLNVAKDNPRAQELYARCGYARVAHEPGVWSYPDENGKWHTVEEPAWRMVKELSRELER